MSGNVWLSARELAGLPGLPGSERRCRDKLAQWQVPARPRAGRVGGGLEYDVAALPLQAREALAARQLAQAGPVLAPALVEVAPQAPAPAVARPAALVQRQPSDADKRVADARAALVHQVHGLARVHGVKRACALVALQLASGQADEALQGLARAANQKARGTGGVSARTLERWVALHREGAWWALLPAPAPAAPPRLAEEVTATLGLYHSRDARFRNLSDAAREAVARLGLARDAWRSVYERSRRALQKADKVALIKARHSGAQRAAQLPFKRRDTSQLAPLDVWLVDGHTFKAKVRHPDHGGPFAPELTVVLDAATRLICGWSVALSENVWAVGDALRHAIGRHGVPAIVYSDNGAGETARAMDCPVDGFMARLGIEHRTGIPGHPQGHGLIERSWRTHAIQCARQFGSYQGRDVDAGSFRKVAAELAREQRALERVRQGGGRMGELVQLSPKLPDWRQFVAAVEAMVDAYNKEHRHRALPKGADGRHMTPAQAWGERLDKSLQHIPDTAQLRALFMPAALRTAQRGQVTLFNQHYQAPELMAMDVDGKRVSVRYDIHDPQRVQGRWVCEALWDANRIDYFPKPVIQMAREKRVAAAVKRRQQQIDTALRELQPALAAAAGAQAAFVPVWPVGAGAPEAALEVAAVSAADSGMAGGQAAQGDARPFFDAPSERYEWLMRHRSAWAEDDARWLEGYAQSDDYEQLSAYYASRGLAWGGRQGAADTDTDTDTDFESAQAPVAASA